VLVEELEAGAHVGQQCGLAPTEDDWPDEQLELVDQPGHESLCCEVRATDKEIPTGGCFQVMYRAGVEVTFEPGVFAVDGAARLEEYTTLSAACHTFA
jgi:hypothetical protein